MGISKLLLNEAILKLEKCASIKLDATPAGRPVYLKFGFKDEYTLYRMTHPSVSKIQSEKGSLEARQVMPEDLSELAWLIRENNKVVGYCLGRKGVNFTQIGPVYGSSEKIAKSLIRSAINGKAGEAVVVDIHAAQTGLMRWLEECTCPTTRTRGSLKVNT